MYSECRSKEEKKTAKKFGYFSNGFWPGYLMIPMDMLTLLYEMI
jgi:hypothetical protein